MSGFEAMRPWLLRACCSLVIMAANAGGVAFTNERLTKAALAVAYTTALTAAAVFWRIARLNDTGRSVRVPHATDATQPPTLLTVRAYDTKSLRDLCSSVAVVRACVRMRACRCASPRACSIIARRAVT